MKAKHACAYCDERFVKISEHMIHVTLVCEPKARAEGRLLLRKVSCWRCAQPVDPVVLRCDCGWVHPRVAR